MNLSGYTWFDDGEYCFTFVRDLTPEEALRRFGVEFADEEDIDEGLVTAYPVKGGTLVVEDNGYAGTLDEIQSKLSVGTVTASVFRNVNHDQSFEHWEDGRPVLRFDPQFPSESLDGGDPDRYLAEMRALGLLTEGGGDGPGAGVHLALSLAMHITGVTVDEVPDEGGVSGYLEEDY